MALKATKNIDTSKFSELLLSDVNIIVVSSDEGGNVIYVSPATEIIIGYKATQLLGLKWWEKTYFSKEEMNIYKQKVIDIISGKIELNPNAYERKLKCSDGSLKWIEWRDSLGSNNTFISVGVDITEWKKKEEINTQSDAIIRNVDSMILVSNMEGGVLYASPSVEKTLGYSFDEIKGDNWWKVTYKNQQDANMVKEAIYKYVFFGEKDFTDITKRKIKTKNGDYKWIEWQVSKGPNNSYISIGTDITERIISEIEIKKAKEAAELSLKVKNEFLANMSHEIRTPLNSIIGFTDLLLETDLSNEQREQLETMRNSGEILLSLINNVLDLAKLDSKKLEIEDISFNLHKHIYEVVKLMKLKADEKHISLDFSIEPNTPKFVLGDPTRLGQILLNLIGNAIKFTDKGGVFISVKEIESNGVISEVSIEVKDTGIGIVSNKVQTVFGAFTQAKSDTSRIYGGTGLGLTIVKKLINLLKGTISVESEFGKGSTFTIVLPFKIASEEAHKEKEIQNLTVDEPLGLKILLVEDNKTNQLLAKTRLERWKCTVDIANNGIEGVKKVQKNKYDIILMDVQMPIMDGFEATKIIKNDISERASKIPVIAMTAFASNSDIKKARNAGMDDYIFKPFKPKELYQLLKKYGNRKSEIEENSSLKKETETAGKELKKLTNLEFLREETQGEASILALLIELFIKDFEEFLKDSTKALSHENWEAIYQAAHKIKPSISMFGISKMDPVIHDLLNKTKNKKGLENVESLMISCKELFKLVKIELTTELKLLKDD